MVGAQLRQHLADSTGGCLLLVLLLLLLWALPMALLL
jgi:hypothetical protein